MTERPPKSAYVVLLEKLLLEYQEFLDEEIKRDQRLKKASAALAFIYRNRVLMRDLGIEKDPDDRAKEGK